jgi:hypothetical protein
MPSRDRYLWARYLRHAPAGWRPHKYGACAVQLDGLRFDSKREAARYQELKTMLAAGLIAELMVHPPYALMVTELFHDGPPAVFHTIGMFHPDFRYVDLLSGELVVEDVKSPPTRTTAYKLRKRMVEASYGITVREIA